MRTFLPTLLCLVLMAGPAPAQSAADAVAPEAAVAIAKKQRGEPVRGTRWMVAVANPHAARAAAGVLAGGGTATDAAIAAQAMLGLVEPQSSGLGGGAFFVRRDGATGEIVTLDGRETAPMAATPRLFQNEDGEPLAFFGAVVGGRSVGVPGTPALLRAMHERFGRTPYGDLLAPAIALAREGFAVSPRLAGLVNRAGGSFAADPVTQDYFLPRGTAVAAGDRLANPAYAATLETLARDDGLDVFYRGAIARRIVEKVRGHPLNPGVLTAADMAAYAVKERAPVCAPYRGHQVCGMGPPSSGAVAVGQILGLLEPFDLAALGPDDVESWRLMGDASRLAFADRGRYLADTDYVPVPVKGLLSPDYLRDRAERLRTGRALAEVMPGEPEWDHAALPRADDASLELPSTSHISIVDAAGNAVSMTTTIENGFGSRLMVDGFLLNNELTDFSFRSHRDGVPIANRVEPGKRPRSSMAPTIVTKDGELVAVVGSPGGSRIIPYVANTIVALIDWKLDPQAAVSRPHLVARFATYDVEAGTRAEAMGRKLETLGFTVKARGLTSGLHVIMKEGEGLSGGADPRREGIVIAR